MEGGDSKNNNTNTEEAEGAKRSPLTAQTTRYHQPYPINQNNYYPNNNSSFMYGYVPTQPPFYHPGQSTHTFPCNQLNPLSAPHADAQFHPEFSQSSSNKEPLPLPPRKKIKKERSKKNSPLRCSLCVVNHGVYADLCPGRSRKNNCDFFHENGDRQKCTHCADERCDGGNGESGKYCRSYGVDIRMSEELHRHFCSGSCFPKSPPLNTIVRFPSNTSCQWSIDSENGVIVADFTHSRSTVSKADLDCLLNCYQIPNAVVISKWLAQNTLLSSDNESSRDKAQHIIRLLRHAEEYIEQRTISLSDYIREFNAKGESQQYEPIDTLESFLGYLEQRSDRVLVSSTMISALYSLILHSSLTLFKVSYRLPSWCIRSAKGEFYGEFLNPGDPPRW